MSNTDLWQAGQTATASSITLNLDFGLGSPMSFGDFGAGIGDLNLDLGDLSFDFGGIAVAMGQFDLSMRSLHAHLADLQQSLAGLDQLLTDAGQQLQHAMTGLGEAFDDLATDMTKIGAAWAGLDAALRGTYVDGSVAAATGGGLTSSLPIRPGEHTLGIVDQQDLLPTLPAVSFPGALIGVPHGLVEARSRGTHHPIPADQPYLERKGILLTPPPGNNGPRCGDWLEGLDDIDVYRKKGDRVTDIDRVQDGILWEEKSAINGVNHKTGNDDTAQWIGKQIVKKTKSYLDARRYIPGYESADIGFSFVEPGVDPSFRSAILDKLSELAADHGIDIHTKWCD